jgi:hypothetical protein
MDYILKDIVGDQLSIIDYSPDSINIFISNGILQPASTASKKMLISLDSAIDTISNIRNNNTPIYVS